MLYRIMIRSVLILLVATVVTACMAKKETILPTRHERLTLVDVYKRCVANATNSRYDKFSSPDVIVRAAMNKCDRSKNAMLREYPKSWRRGLERDVDEELYRREIAWVKQTRAKLESEKK